MNGNLISAFCKLRIFQLFSICSSPYDSISLYPVYPYLQCVHQCLAQKWLSLFSTNVSHISKVRLVKDNKTGHVSFQIFSCVTLRILILYLSIGKNFCIVLLCLRKVKAQTLCFIYYQLFQSKYFGWMSPSSKQLIFQEVCLCSFSFGVSSTACVSFTCCHPNTNDG